MTVERARRVSQWGMIPQMTMIVAYILTLLLYGKEVQRTPYRILDIAGSLIFLYCLYELYVRRRRLTGLITDGVFKYTRHPMYTGLFLMNLVHWLPHPVSMALPFFLLQAVFLTCLVLAGWFQEQETLERFGAEATDYYRRTPRLFFMYPFYAHRH